MFYCEPCRLVNAWPGAFSVSRGTCEVCGIDSECYDRPSSTLPMPKDAHEEERIAKRRCIREWFMRQDPDNVTIGMVSQLCGDGTPIPLIAALAQGTPCGPILARIDELCRRQGIGRI